MKEKVDIIAYHADCPDGFCAAFVVQKQWPTAELLPCTYGMLPPLDACNGKNLIVVDFSWKREVCLALQRLTNSILILDHHQTAEAELHDLSFAQFDVTRSGAQMAWDYCFLKRRPWYVDYTADRDLWRWKLPESRAVSAYIMALPHTIAAWEELDRMTAFEAAALGRGALAHVEHYVTKVCEQAYAGRWQGLSIKIVNAAYLNISDVCNRLCEQGAQVGLGWFVRGDGLIQFSLRSIGEIDVSELAKQFGGGGHRNAAGFQIPAADAFKLLDTMVAL